MSTCIVNPNISWPQGIPFNCTPNNTGFNNTGTPVNPRNAKKVTYKPLTPVTPAPPIVPPRISNPPGTGTGTETNTGIFSGPGIFGLDNLTLLLIGSALLAVIYFIKKK